MVQFITGVIWKDSVMFCARTSSRHVGPQDGEHELGGEATSFPYHCAKNLDYFIKYPGLMSFGAGTDSAKVVLHMGSQLAKHQVYILWLSDIQL